MRCIVLYITQPSHNYRKLYGAKYSLESVDKLLLMFKAEERWPWGMTLHCGVAADRAVGELGEEEEEGGGAKDKVCWKNLNHFQAD